jgi:hypothetical protein
MNYGMMKLVWMKFHQLWVSTPQMPQVENVESPNSRMVVVVGLDEIPSTSTP